MARLDPLLKNRTALFWTLQIGGWLAYALSQYLGTLLYDTKYEHMKGYTTVIVHRRGQRLPAEPRAALHLPPAVDAFATRHHRRGAVELLCVRAGLARDHQFFVSAVHERLHGMGDEVRARVLQQRDARRPICCCAGPASISASSTTSRCSSSARRRCARRRSRRKRSSRCCVTSSIPTFSSIRSTRSRP